MKLPKDRKRRRKSFGRVVLSVLLSLVFVGAIVAAVVMYARSELARSGPHEAEAVVAIKRGMGSGQIATALERAGVVRNRRTFLLAILATRQEGTLKAGEYAFPKGASMAEILAQMRVGKVLEHKVSIPEGLTTQQALLRIQENEQLTGEIGENVPAEGSLLPDTYLFPSGTTRADVIKRMQAAQRSLVDKLWEKRAEGLPFRTKREAIILASIVEKETGISGERARVAAVFVNRLRRGMRLQSDPTIIYGIVGGKGKLDRPIRRSDINATTPYNTYRIDGLPPTPIANPGQAAIEAVLNPDTSDELFFVADGTGGHVFARTLGEHEANVKKWRQIEAERNAAAEAPADPDGEPDSEAPTTDAPAGDQAAAGDQPTAGSDDVPVPGDKPETEAEAESAPAPASNVPLPKPKPKRP